jgi:hypothetical protein
MSGQADKLEAIMKERGEVYGSIEESFGAIAQGWQAIVDFNNGKINDDTVALMMAYLKIIRATRVYKEDNYDDGMNYFKIANDLKKPPGILPIDVSN